MDRAADGWGEGGAWPQSVFDALSVRLSDVPPATLGVQHSVTLTWPETSLLGTRSHCLSDLCSCGTQGCVCARR